MSEEFRNDQENLNSQQNSAGTEEHTENQSQNANTAGGTTYSWVNPKLRQDQGQQAEEHDIAFFHFALASSSCCARASRWPVALLVRRFCASYMISATVMTP